MYSSVRGSSACSTRATRKDGCRTNLHVLMRVLTWGDLARSSRHHDLFRRVILREANRFFSRSLPGRDRSGGMRFEHSPHDDRQQRESCHHREDSQELEGLECSRAASLEAGTGEKPGGWEISLSRVATHALSSDVESKSL